MQEKLLTLTNERYQYWYGFNRLETFFGLTTTYEDNLTFYNHRLRAYVSI